LLQSWETTMARGYSFGPFQLDLNGGPLLKLDVPVGVGAKGLALLRTLLEADGRVVSKADLMDSAWPHSDVEESNLTVQISALRRHLGLSPEGTPWIVTHSRWGYRFAGATRVEVSEEPNHPRSPGRSGFERDHAREAHECFVQGRSLYMHAPQYYALARALLTRAIELDPGLAEAHAWLAVLLHVSAQNNAEHNVRSLAVMHARAAVALDSGNSVAHWALGYVLLYEGHVAAAEESFEQALEIRPNYADAFASIASLRVLQGRPRLALHASDRGFSLNRFPPVWYTWNRGFVLYSAGHYADVIEALGDSHIDVSPARRIRAASLAQLGHRTEAQREAREFLRRSPFFSATEWGRSQPFSSEADRQHFNTGYVRAGLPT
jgi:DNA-binding winged helix-turn-helix (wHTH) protein/lipoprotein NlpI